MNCFYHQDVVSVGLCRSCLRGLCASCAKEIDSGIACVNRCEEDAKMVTSYLKQSMNNTDSYRQAYNYSNRYATLILPLFFVVLGILYASMPWFYGGDGGFTYAVGFLFVVFGLALFLRGRRIKAIFDKDQPS